jgi:uncharacterized membrane protein YgcG
VIRRALVALLLLAAGVRAGAAPRALHWKSLTADARLDRDGVLHVRERQHLVMTGDWNGGERAFRLEPAQRIELEGIVRIDPATGAAVALRPGTLAAVDEYSWADERTLRWRSRLPADPPFASTERVYELTYRLYGAVEKQGAGYVLEHEFAFADRPGLVLSHVVDLDVDPAWRVTTGPQRLHVDAGGLAVGASPVLRVGLQYQGTGEPAHVATTALRDGLHLTLWLVPLLLFAEFLLSEWRRGRFESVPALAPRTAGWMEANLLVHRPEVLGAFADGTIGPEEASAVVARLTGEGALRSRAEGRELHLELVRDRETLQGYERALVDGLFFEGRTETSTAAIEKHYRALGRGFYPASEIRKGVEAAAAALAGPGRTRFPYWVLTLGALLAAVTVLAMAPTEREFRWMLGILFGFPAIVVGLAGIAVASSWRRRVASGPLGTIALLVPATILLALAWAAAGSRMPPLDRLARVVADTGPVARSIAIAATLLALGLVSSILNNARTRDRLETLRLRKRLAAARRFFETELERPEPALRDEWFPYVLAFGLDESSRRWFERYGTPPAASSARTGASAYTRTYESSSSSGSASATPATWTGGGGAFGGAGATASWAAAAGTLSAGVAMPVNSSSGSGGSSYGGGSRSSGGSSGSSGGGSRSGGGSGGGW